MCWLQYKACDIERVMKSEVGAWKVLRDLPRGRAGLHLVKTRAIRDSKGNLCVGKTVSGEDRESVPLAGAS